MAKKGIPPRIKRDSVPSVDVSPIPVSIDDASVAHSVASEFTEEVRNPRSRLASNSNGPDGNSLGCGSSLVGATPSTVRSFRRLRANRSRVPGGAAAKLIGTSIEDNFPISDDGDEALEIMPPSDELDRIRMEAKTEFVIGRKNNRRYHTEENNEEDLDEQSDGPSEASLPSILNRSEVFHENAKAAVISLLQPPGHLSRQQDALMSIPSSRSQTSMVSTPPKQSVFQPPPRDDDSSSVVTTLSGEGLDYQVATSSGRNVLQQPLLSQKAKNRVDQVKQLMKDPNKTLADLISAIASPKDGVQSCGYMVRRKNACGAMQVLTAKTVHRIQICWTVGVLPALTSVLQDSGDRAIEEIFPDRQTRQDFLEARKRAVSALMNLAMPSQNRLAVFHSPRLVYNLVRVINLDEGESCKGCCAVLAQLAKTSENRLLMAQVPGLMDAVSAVIEPKPCEEDDDKYAGPDDDVASYGSSGDDTPLYAVSTSDASAGAPDIVDSFVSEGVDDSTASVCNIEPKDPTKESKMYDNDLNVHLNGSRQNVFALLSHLIKEKDNSYLLARNLYLMETLVAISKLNESPVHEQAVRILANLTRHRGNSKHTVFKLRKVVPAFVNASFSQNDGSRKYACFGLQNLSQDKPCRQELAATPGLLSALCVRVRQASDPEERLAAIHALKNLTDDPANLIPMTNTPECFATLMQIAHASDDSVTEMMQYLGCDALATLSHWFRSIATSGQRIDYQKRNEQPPKDLFKPSLKIVAWEQWQ